MAYMRIAVHWQQRNRRIEATELRFLIAVPGIETHHVVVNWRVIGYIGLLCKAAYQRNWFLHGANLDAFLFFCLF
jgi:hypothetical protein